MTDPEPKPPSEMHEVEHLRAIVQAQAQQIAAMRDRLDALIRQVELKNPPGDESKN